MKSLARIRKRQGRAYELAFKVMLDESEADQWTLVHGILVNPKNGVRMDHAWIDLNDGRVYDTTLDRYVPTVWYMARYQVEVDHRYSCEEMSRLLSVSHNSGPWTDDE